MGSNKISRSKVFKTEYIFERVKDSELNYTQFEIGDTFYKKTFIKMKN